jgi:ParB family transcriptional regulator, chromosome partitioning protein
MQVLIEDIIIKDRVRTEIGDLKSLMESMRLHGQLNPVTITRENELVAGHRRTLAARELGWKFIEAHVIERSSEIEKLQIELEENVHRKDFSPEELLAGYRRLDKLLNPTIGHRIGCAVKSFFCKVFGRKKKPVTKTQPNETGEAESRPEKPAGTLQNPVTTESRPQKEADVIGSQFGI